MKVRYSVVVAAIALGLGGCASYKPVTSVAYNQGFDAGCESGNWYDNSEIKNKNFSRVHERAYMIGWDEGFSECRYNIYRPGQVAMK